MISCSSVSFNQNSSLNSKEGFNDDCFVGKVSLKHVLLIIYLVWVLEAQCEVALMLADGGQDRRDALIDLRWLRKTFVAVLGVFAGWIEVEGYGEGYLRCFKRGLGQKCIAKLMPKWIKCFFCIR